MTKRKHSRRGAALVEGALVFLIFAGMLIGTLDFGQFLFIQQTLVERAREGVRYGIVNDPTDSTSIQNIVLYGQASGGAVPVNPGNSDTGIFNLARSNVSVSATGSGTDDYRLVVLIQGYRYRIYSPWIAGTYNGPNITASLPLGINF